MRLCPRCRSEFSDNALEVCPFDSWGLVTPEDYYEGEGDPLLGATLGGRFRIVGRLGVGAMGTVYKALQASVDRMVALKVLRPDLTKDPDTAARFHREAHSTSALKHPSTVTLYDFGQTPEGYLFIAMELLEGRLLGRLLKEEGALPVDLSTRIAIQIARSLAEAHRKGIVHRDLKPDNIMLAQVEGQEVVKVLDFGIAKVIRGERRIDALETQAGTVFGTPRYMSPEQAQSKPLDARSDLYSLGVIFYQMLCGHAPFEDSDAVVVMARHIKTKPRRPSDVRPDLKIPPRLERLVMRLMEKDRNRRPQSAEELIEALNHISQGHEDDFGLTDPRMAAPSRNRRFVPFIVAAAAAALLAAGGLIAYALTSGNQGHRGPSTSFSQQRTVAVENGALGLDPPQKLAAPEDTHVTVTIDSEPSGASVLRDGHKLGKTPLVLNEERGAEVSLEFLLEGYQSSIEVVAITPDDTTHLVSLSKVKNRPVQTSSPGGPRPVGKEGTTPAEDLAKTAQPPTSQEKRPRYGRFDDR